MNTLASNNTAMNNTDNTNIKLVLAQHIINNRIKPFVKNRFGDAANTLSDNDYHLLMNNYDGNDSRLFAHTFMLIAER